MTDTILFDLDGTLLPMVMDDFMTLYFKNLVAKCVPYGFEPKALTEAVWYGTKLMVKNDGSRSNKDVFWQAFGDKLGKDVTPLQPELELFYEHEFHNTKAATRPNPGAAGLVRGLKQKGYRLVLATNPLFPKVAVQTRLSWLGLGCDDFDHVTSYENCSYSKPNPAYYREITEALDLDAARCLMVGNDVDEDGCARSLGMDFYLVTDDVINASGQDLSGIASGSFEECLAWCEGLPALA